MPYADKKKHAKYYRDYYHSHPEYRAERVKASKLNYWRRKFMMKFNCSLIDCKKFALEELQEQIKTELCKI